MEADQFQIHHYLSSISLLQAEAVVVLVTQVAEEREDFSQGASLLRKEFHIRQQWEEAVQHTMRDLYRMDQTGEEESV